MRIGCKKMKKAEKNKRKKQEKIKKALDKKRELCYNKRCEKEWGIAKR